MDTTNIQDTNNQRSVTELIRDLRDETVTLMRKELELAKTELAEKATEAGKNAAKLAAGGVVAYTGAVVLLYAIALFAGIALAWAGVPGDFAAWLGPAIIGLAVTAIGWFMIQNARYKLSTQRLTPDKTIQSLREDKVWTQQKLQRT